MLPHLPPGTYFNCVQSEEERQLRKFIRREDKRSGKKESRGEDMPLSPTVFDPESMRIARYRRINVVVFLHLTCFLCLLMY